MDKLPYRVIGNGSIGPDTEALIRSFFSEFNPLEVTQGADLVLYYDEKSQAHYLMCHLEGRLIQRSCDIEASLDGDDEDEIYKLNRDITENQEAFREMVKDALGGRSFEDMVIEYDKSYKPDRPLKVYGGQHRVRAIQKALETKGHINHGMRVYFNLSREQKLEIATINNTSIAVPNDLMDRMREQLLGADLRSFCQRVGLLGDGEDFPDSRSPDVPTVRIARTLLVNYYRGLDAPDKDLHQPILCKSGGIDEAYMTVRDRANWSEPRLIEMGTQFARLNKAQRETVLGRKEDSYAEYARKAMSLAVVASWGYAAGLFQRNPDHLKILYEMPDSVSRPEDPLNAKALSQARLKGTDPDTYRGLGTRSTPRELGRMLEVFLVLAQRGKKRISRDLANAAIQNYEANKAKHEAEQRLERI